MNRPRSAEVSRLVSQELAKRGRNGQMSWKKKLASRHIDQAKVGRSNIGGYNGRKVTLFGMSTLYTVCDLLPPGFIHLDCTFCRYCISDIKLAGLLSIYTTVPQRVPILGTFLTFWVPVGSLFIFQGPYFHCFG